MPPRSKDEGALKKGDKVQAKWSGSNVYYPATVLSLSGQQCKVQFDDGSVLSVKVSDTKPVRSSSAAQQKGRRTRSRSSSGGRTTRSSRSRSPSRRTSSTPKPEKKSPTRREKGTNAVSKNEEEGETRGRARKSEDRTSVSKLPRRSEERKSSVTKTSRKSEEATSVSKAVSSLLSNSTSQKIVYSEVVEKEVHQRISVPRSSARIAAMQVVQKSSEPVVLVKRVLQPAEKKLEYSDDEEEETEEEDEEEEEEERKDVKRKQFSYLSFAWVTAKIMLLPLFILFFCFACTKRSCNLLYVPPSYSKWKDVENDLKYPLPACAVLHFLLFALSKIPVGKEVKGFAYGAKGLTSVYRLNGFYILLLFLLAFAGSFYYELYLNWGYDKIRGFVVSSLLYSTVFSVVMHCVGLCSKTTQEDMKANRRSGFLGSFYYGHEINPVFCFGEDVKTRFIHFGLIGLVLLDLSMLTKTFFMKGYSIPLTMTASMHIFFVLDYLWREEVMLSSATYTNDGVGYGFIVSTACVIPCSFALQSSYLVRNASKLTPLPHWCSAAIVLIYIFGYYIYVASSNLKHSFRRNPYSPSLTYVDSIPTSQKKRLIVSGLWGIVRHPNYFGVIIMSIACSLPCGFTHLLPYSPLILITVMLCLRSFTVESLCKEKYGPAWKNYTTKVRSRLIPYIF